MNNVYKNPCTRCGMCCMSTPCPIALEKVIGAEKGKRCPALDMQDTGNEDGLARCALMDTFISEKPELEKEIKLAFGIGVGCCIKATAMALGKPYNFADLPKELKRALTLKQFRMGR